MSASAQRAHSDRWRSPAAILFLSVALVILPPARVHARPVCEQKRLLIGGGYTDVLGYFGELGVRCLPVAGLRLAAGFRYTDQRATTAPFVVLSYDVPFGAGWSVGLVASGRERGGDYEIDRLPELYLRWNPPVGPVGLVPSVQLFAGSITTFRVLQTTRAGGIVGLTTRPIRLGAMTDLVPGIQYGSIAYGTGQSHSYWIGTVSLVVRPGPRTELRLAYLKQEGTGTSPLAFDQVNLDHLLTARVAQAVTARDWVGFAVVFTLVTPPTTVKEYTLSWMRAGAWTASVTYRLTDSRVFLGLVLP